MVRILLTHSPEALALYYGERALKGLHELGEVRLHEGREPLQGEQLIRAAENCDMIISYRQSPAPAEIFERLPKLVAFLRCAIDIRNIDVAAASKAGVLVTQASAGFVTAVAEMVLGFMVDLSRGITRSTMDYRGGGSRRRRWEGNCAAARSASSATAPSARRFPEWGKLSACGCSSTILT